MDLSFRLHPDLQKKLFYLFSSHQIRVVYSLPGISAADFPGNLFGTHTWVVRNGLKCVCSKYERNRKLRSIAEISFQEFRCIVLYYSFGAAKVSSKWVFENRSGDGHFRTSDELTKHEQAPIFAFLGFWWGGYHLRKNRLSFPWFTTSCQVRGNVANPAKCGQCREIGPFGHIVFGVM